MVKNKNILARRLVALANLEKAEYVETPKRTKEQWEKRRAYNIKVLKERTQGAS